VVLLRSIAASFGGANRVRTPVWQPVPHFLCELFPRRCTLFPLLRPPTHPSLDHLDSSDDPPTPHPHIVHICVTGVWEQEGAWAVGRGVRCNVREKKKEKKKTLREKEKKTVSREEKNEVERLIGEN
jgi:hypothetical protein